MAVLYVAEYSDLGRSEPGMIQAAQSPVVTRQVLAIGAGSVQSAAFNASTRYIRVHTDAICAIAIDFNPTAANSGTQTERLAADQTEYFGVKAGMKIAVIQNT